MDGPAPVVLLFEPSPALLAYLAAALQDIAELIVVPEGPARSEALAIADVAIGWRVSAAELAAAPQLRLYVNPGAGVQHLIPVFRELASPPLLLNSHGNAYATAQHAVALLLTLTNKVVPHHNWMVEGRWRMGDEAAASVPLRALTVGLLGYGNVNQHVHRFLSGFELDFCILSRSRRLPGHRFAASIEDLMSVSDIVVCAVPLTDETTGMIGSRELALLGPRGLLVNVARGPVVRQEDLYLALRDGQIGGAALDVWYDYSPPADAAGTKRPYSYPFHELPNVVMSPHRSASPLDDLMRWEEVVANIRRFLAGGQPEGLVDIARGY